MNLFERTRPLAIALPRLAQPVVSRLADLALGVPTRPSQLTKWLSPDAGARTVTTSSSILLMAVEKAYPSSRGGYAARTHALAKGLEGHGWKVVVLARTGATSVDSLDIETIDGVQYRLCRPKYSRWEPSIKEWENRILSATLELQPQVVWASSSALWTALPALRASTRAGVQMIYDVRGFSEVTRILSDVRYRHTKGYKAKRLAEKFVIENADICCVIDSRLAQIAPFIPTDAIVVPNSSFLMSTGSNAATCRSENTAGNDRLQLSYAGSLHEYEGIEILLHAIQLLRHKGRDVELHLVGSHALGVTTSNSALNRLARLAKQYCIEDLVTFYGSLPPQEAQEIIAASDLFVVPRLNNDITQAVPPMKTFTAMALGVPLVTSDVGPLKDLIARSRGGYTFRANNAADLCRVVEEATEDRKILEEIGMQAQYYVQHFQHPRRVVAGLVAELNRRGIAP